MREFGQSVLGIFSAILEFIHDLVEPAFGVHSWGWAIIGLTLFVRILLLPLAIKQTRSMKAMQQLQPQMKEIQDKYKTTRDMMRKDPEKYRARKQKQQQEMMALYQREGANPAASCLPLLAQAPVFIALFWTLRDEAELLGAPFYFFTEATAGGLEKLVSAAGWPGWLLILLMSGTMFFSQKQMMARNAASMVDNPMAQQQKILLYVMPVFLAVISFQFPLGILLYWVTTNFWQILQQAVILRESSKLDDPNGNGNGNGSGVGKGSSAAENKPGGGSATSGSRGATSGRASGGSTGSASSGRQRGAAAAGVGPEDATGPDVEKISDMPPVGDGGTGNGTSGDDLGGATSGPSPASRRRLPKRGSRR